MATFYVCEPDVEGDGSGDSWANAMSLAEWDAYMDASAAAGDIYYVEAGTYTLTGAVDFSGKPGTAVAPITIIGVIEGTEALGEAQEPPTYARWSPIGSVDRPEFVQATNAITFGAYYKVFNCIFSGAVNGDMVTYGTYCVNYNCKYTQAYAGSDKYCTRLSTQGSAISCEYIANDGGSNFGGGIYGVGGNNRVLFCHFHDFRTGYGATASNNVFAFNVFDNATMVGISCSTTGNTALNNTFYGTVRGIFGQGSARFVGINNIMDTLTTGGFIWTTQNDSNFFLHNHDGNNVVDMWALVDETNPPHMDNEETTGDPKFTTAGSDFSLAADSPCIDAGKTIALGVG